MLRPTSLAGSTGSDSLTLGGDSGFWQRVGGPARAGHGVVVGLVDSGIWPENPSFGGLPQRTPGTAPQLPGFHGSCEAADEWTADRLGALERNILRMAILELDRGEVPHEVAIDEAVTLAKRYSSEDAGRLVNGILGRIVKEAA